MTIFPPAIIVINNDLTPNVQDMIVRQLAIDEILDGYEYDSRADGYFLAEAKRDKKRILIIRSLAETFDRNDVDIVGFVSHGLIAIEENKFGPHGFTFPIVNLTWSKLGIFEIR